VSFEPTLASLRTHSVPDWYHDAKLGIFMHWSLAAVPGFAPREHEIGELLREHYWRMQPLSPYSEWYENSLRFAWSPVAQHHRATWGDRAYADFRREFEAALERWDPAPFADLIAASGARYFVLVTKHHDGYCLWPSDVPNPRRPGWHSRRDVVGELAQAVRARGLRFGVYYSGGLDWRFDATPIRTLCDLVAALPGGDYPAYAEAQLRELIRRYAPEVLWNDIAWPTHRAQLFQLFADYYAAVPEGVVNDRWLTPNAALRLLRFGPLRRLADAWLARAVRRSRSGLHPPPPPHYDARTPEYAVFDEIRREKWECVRGIDKSFGYNRLSRPEDHLSRRELLTSFVDIVAKNGNLLLNLGPRGEDAAIPELQAERLRWLGSFLAKAGDVVYGSRPWLRAEGETDAGIALRFTRAGDGLGAFLLDTPKRPSLLLRGLRAGDAVRARWCGHGEVDAHAEAGGVRVAVPAGLADEPVHALRLDGIVEA
jgi:alpha-L-fucosidase